MLDWLRKFWSGDASSVPAGMSVARDELGRVVRVEGTLTAGDGRATGAHPGMQLADEVTPRLDQACRWLRLQNIQLAHRYGVGTEARYDFDQQDGRLTLVFEDGRRLVARGQILGSFDPREGSFMWSWANTSILPELSQDALRFRDAAPDLVQAPTVAVKFDDLTQVLALATQVVGAHGLYRAFMGWTSVFVGFRVDELYDAACNLVTAESFVPDPPAPSLLEAAHALACAYDEEMLALDRNYNARGDEGDLEQLIVAKTAVYDRYWHRDDDFCKPCSHAWPSDHDAEAAVVRFTTPHVRNSVLDVTIRTPMGQNVYRVEGTPEGPRIVDSPIEWGEGFIWPRSASERAATAA